MEKSWCEVCQFEAKAKTLPELFEIWKNHIETTEHENNVGKFLQYDLGALTPDEIPKKLDEMLDSSDEK